MLAICLPRYGPSLTPGHPPVGCACAVVCALGGRGASTPSRAWAAPCLSPRVPHAVLTPPSLLLRPSLLTHCAAPLAQRHSARRLHGRGTSAVERKEVTMIQRG